MKTRGGVRSEEREQVKACSPGPHPMQALDENFGLAEGVIRLGQAFPGAEIGLEISCVWSGDCSQL